VEWLARYKPKQLARSGCVRPVVAALCALCAEPEPPEHDNDDQLSAAKFAAQVRACFGAPCCPGLHITGNTHCCHMRRLPCAAHVGN
jgi:hypothetical protein